MTPPPKISEAGLHILQHALGLDQYGQGESYRRHFVTGEGSVDHPDCMALVERGLMTRQAGSQLTGDMDAFFVTDAGRQAVRDHSPPPPKLTRSQKRYRAWLDADAPIPFSQWIKRGEPAR